MTTKKKTTTISLQSLDELFGTSEEIAVGISEVSLGSLYSFPNHPFQVKDDKKWRICQKVSNNMACWFQGLYG